MFAIYLEFCVIVGNFKWGLRIPWLIELHPMRTAGTLVSSFLVNAELLLVASFAVSLFCARSFSVYVRVTSINSMDSFNLPSSPVFFDNIFFGITKFQFFSHWLFRYLQCCRWMPSRNEMGMVCLWMDYSWICRHYSPLFYVPTSR